MPITLSTPPSSRTAPPSPRVSTALYDQPGHLVRRAHQISVSMFRETMSATITPTQYAVLRMLQQSPGIDQVTLATLIALDNSTTADIAKRLEKKGLIRRDVGARRQLSLATTAEGEALVNALASRVEVLHDRMLDNMTDEEQAEFMRLLRKFVHLNGEQGRQTPEGNSPGD